jgi:hypothetical protein
MPFGLRKAAFYLVALAAAPTPELLAKGKQGQARLLQALQPRLTGEILINALDVSNPESTQAAFTPANYQRLVALKNQYDPKNVFHFNHNISPSQTE